MNKFEKQYITSYKHTMNNFNRYKIDRKTINKYFDIP